MQVNVRAFKADGSSHQFEHITYEVDLSEFDGPYDADGVRETLDIVICDDCGVIDIDEEDLYVEAERVYQKLNGDG